MMRVFVLACCMALAGAVETGPLAVVSTSDGDTIAVHADLGGHPLVVKVRLLWIDTPEKRDNAHGTALREGMSASVAMAAILPKGRAISLWGPGDRFQVDTYGRVLAVIHPLAADGTRSGQSVQELLIRAGWSAYWRKYGEAPEPLHATLIAAQDAARAALAGAWATAPDHMRDKANERTAPAIRAPR